MPGTQPMFSEARMASGGGWEGNFTVLPGWTETLAETVGFEGVRSGRGSSSVVDFPSSEFLI